jgi:hypothetical protein
MTHSSYGSIGELFLTQGRPDFPPRGCAVLCITTYRDRNSGKELRIPTKERISPPTDAHCEELIFKDIIEREEKDNRYVKPMHFL